MSEKSEKCLKKRKYDSKYKSEWKWTEMQFCLNYLFCDCCL